VLSETSGDADDVLRDHHRLALHVSGSSPVRVSRSTITPRGWSALVFLGIMLRPAYIAWYDALKHMPASQVGALLYLEPLVAMTVAAVVLSEPILLSTVVGGAVILIGVWLVNRRPGEPGPAPEVVVTHAGEE
jgi:drug/metabolite transporter (DMT)-like permease